MTSVIGPGAGPGKPLLTVLARVLSFIACYYIRPQIDTAAGPRRQLSIELLGQFGLLLGGVFSS